MSVEYQNIINLLKDLSHGQRTRLYKCIQDDAGLMVCLGKRGISVLHAVKDIESIISGSAKDFCKEIKTSDQFAVTFKSIVYRIISPEDHLMDFLDFRMENWPEE